MVNKRPREAEKLTHKNERVVETLVFLWSKAVFGETVSENYFSFGPKSTW